MKYWTDADAFEAAKTQKMGMQTLRRWPLLWMLGCKETRARSPKQDKNSMQSTGGFFWYIFWIMGFCALIVRKCLILVNTGKRGSPLPHPAFKILLCRQSWKFSFYRMWPEEKICPKSCKQLRVPVRHSLLCSATDLNPLVGREWRSFGWIRGSQISTVATVCKGSCKPSLPDYWGPMKRKEKWRRKCTDSHNFTWYEINPVNTNQTLWWLKHPV